MDHESFQKNEGGDILEDASSRLYQAIKEVATQHAFWGLQGDSFFGKKKPEGIAQINNHIEEEKTQDIEKLEKITLVAIERNKKFNLSSEEKIISKTPQAQFYNSIIDSTKLLSMLGTSLEREGDNKQDIDALNKKLNYMITYMRGIANLFPSVDEVELPEFIKVLGDVLVDTIALSKKSGFIEQKETPFTNTRLDISITHYLDHFIEYMNNKQNNEDPIHAGFFIHMKMVMDLYLQKTSSCLNEENVHGLIAGCFLVSYKFISEHGRLYADEYIAQISSLDLKTLHALELEILKKCEWNVSNLNSLYNPCEQELLQKYTQHVFTLITPKQLSTKAEDSPTRFHLLK